LPASDNPDAPIHPRCSMQTQPANSSAFNRLLATAGLRKVDSPEVKAGSRRQHGQLSFHSLRHTCVSMLHENGLPMATVLEFVGHSSSAMSKKYTHVGIENLRKAASSFQKL
jgi:integrase